MTGQAILQVTLYVALLVALAKPLGVFMANVYEGRRTFLSPVLRPIEVLVHRAARIDEQSEVAWKRYAMGMLLFNVVGFVFVYLLQRLQGLLPLNPADVAAVTPDSSFNTAVSFATNTNWQGYGGESTTAAIS